MLRSRLSCAIGVMLSSAVIAGSQAVPDGALSQALRDHLRNERMDPVTSVRGLPLGVREELQTLFGTRDLDIAEPGAPFNVSDGRDPKLPTRRLMAAGCASDHCLVYYERGGVERSWQVALFHWTPAQTRLEWGSRAPGTLATFDAVRDAVLRGTLKTPNRVW